MNATVFKIAKILIIVVGIVTLIDVATTLYTGGTFMDTIGNLFFGIGMLCFWFIKQPEKD